MFTPIEIIERMEQVIHNERLRSGIYLTHDVVSQELEQAGAICGGRNACMLGALWLGAGIKPEMTETREYAMADRHYELVIGKRFDLPGIREDEREKFLSDKPALLAAYDALNEAADAFADAKGIYLYGEYHASVEDLFEGVGLDNDEALTITAAAKAILAGAK